MTEPHAALLAKVGAYYTQRLEEHGATPRGVDWNGADSQLLRHRQFLRLIEADPAASVLDLGCGYGDFLPYLRAQGHDGAYIGYDVAPAMVEAARALHGEGADRVWRVGASPAETADYAVASGILNVRGDVAAEDWSRYVLDTIDLLGGVSRRGFAFNVLSLSSDPAKRRPNLHYADPVAMLDACLQRFGRRVALLQDYGLFEFTMIVRHA